MERSYTPGPWRIGNAGTAVFGPPNGNPSPETVAAELSRANARLIAEAPAMLELLKKLPVYGAINHATWAEISTLLSRIEGKD